MRIISGIYGRRRFDVPSSFSARPTTDFAKENIFNVVNNLVDLKAWMRWIFLPEPEVSLLS